MAEQKFLNRENINPYPEKLRELKDLVFFNEDLDSFLINQKTPITLDICCGNGEFLVHLAERNKDKTFLGIELQYKEVYRTACKIKNRALKNVKVARIDAKDIYRFFTPGQLADVSILFPDPWPKRKQKKHRLVNQQYFDLLISLIGKGHHLFFKTDNDDYMLQFFECYKNSSLINNMSVELYTRDFHSLEISKKYYITAFERIFIREKKLINAMIIKII